jgi:hypothetical protein
VLIVPGGAEGSQPELIGKGAALTALLGYRVAGRRTFSEEEAATTVRWLAETPCYRASLAEPEKLVAELLTLGA